MRIKEGYMLRETGDSRMVVACEPNAGSFRGMIRLNQSAAMLYRMLEQGATEDQLTDALLREIPQERLALICQGLDGVAAYFEEQERNGKL